MIIRQTRNVTPQQEMEALEFITAQHAACVLMLDTSLSMQNNDAIGKLNNGLRAFKESPPSGKGASLTIEYKLPRFVQAINGGYCE